MFQGALSEPLSPHPRVVCIGETMVMFAPPKHELIEEATTFRSYLGGAESNVAIGLERLGVHAAWIGKLKPKVIRALAVYIHQVSHSSPASGGHAHG